MITDSFDNLTPAIIAPQRPADVPRLDAMIITFSYLIEEYVKAHFDCREIAVLRSVSVLMPVYRFEYNGRAFGFCKTYIGAPSTVGLIEELLTTVNVDRFVMFGGAGCLDKEIARGKIMIPTAAYRDEGTSYHYAPAGDYIELTNSKLVVEFMEREGIPYVLGKTWTTDAFYRETRGNFEKRKSDGCIAVEMEVAAVQAVCDFRGVRFYNFLKSGDLLDAPEWDSRSELGMNGSQHDPRYFRLALGLAEFVCGCESEN